MAQKATVCKAMLQIDQAFMKKYPNIKVEHVGVPGSQFITQMRTFVASRKGPDVVTDGGGSFPVNSGFAKAMRPMYDLLTPQQKNELNPYLDGAKLLVCTRCRRTQTKDARMAKKKERARR